MRQTLIKYLMAYHLEGRKIKPLVVNLENDMTEIYRRNFK